MRYLPTAVTVSLALVGSLQAAAKVVPPTGETSATVPAAVQQVRFDQRLGEPLPLDAGFVDESGREVRLGEYFGERPVLLALVYYDCPMLCTLVLNGVVSGLKPLPLDPGVDFEVVVVSFDARETPALARDVRQETLHRYGRESAAGWHFLTGEETSIRRLADAVGFEYQFQPETGEFSHAAGLVLATPEGRTSRYLYGIEYAPRDLRLALVEASENRIGTAVDQVLLFCFRYDPATGKYTAAVLNLVRAGGLVTILLIAGFVFASTRRDKQRKNDHPPVGIA